MSPPQELRELPVQEIESSPSQPRRRFDEAALKALAGSVGECGVLQPVLVRPRRDGGYRLIVGERRWRAAKIAGLQSIPALVFSYDDAAALEMGLIENMAREDLNPVEEARACEILVRELGLTYRQIGARVGRNKDAVTNLMRLLQLPDDILEFLEYGELSAAHGRALLMAKDPEARPKLARAAIEQGWTVEKLKACARESNTGGPESREGVGDEEGGRGNGQALDETAMNIARVWGDAVGEEVMVRAMSGRKLRVEFVFESPEGALAVGGRLAETLARGSKRR
jgi:ParB family transcriptional regulator, chromosome partitioning protein